MISYDNERPKDDQRQRDDIGEAMRMLRDMTSIDEVMRVTGIAEDEA